MTKLESVTKKGQFIWIYLDLLLDNNLKFDLNFVIVVVNPCAFSSTFHLEFSQSKCDIISLNTQKPECKVPRGQCFVMVQSIISDLQ